MTDAHVGIELAGDLLGTLIIFQHQLEDERFKSAQVFVVAHGALYAARAAPASIEKQDQHATRGDTPTTSIPVSLKRSLTGT
jgi:hypothetical protein